jgi:hypothetical protein
MSTTVNSDLKGQGAQGERKQADIEEALQYLLITNFLHHLSRILVGLERPARMWVHKPL